MKNQLFATILLSTWFHSQIVSAADVYQPKTYKNANAGNELPYRIMLPDGYEVDETKAYPLILFLHGAGERGNDNAKQLKHGAGEFASETNRNKYPAIVLAPQCPSGSFWGRFNGDLFGLLNSVLKEYRVDSSRIYVTGLSMGGFGTWSLIAEKPELFAAAAPICGGGDLNKAEKMTKIPIWAFHGDADTVVKPELSRNMIKAIEKAGGKPKYTEYPGVGHDSWSQTYSNPEFIEWLFSHKKP